jgi:epoxide hydrolase 4
VRRPLLTGTLILAAELSSVRAAPPHRTGLAVIHHEYVTVNGVRFHSAVAGKSAKTILFLHGFPEFWYAWKDQLTEFGRDHTAVAVDMRGCNLSDKPPKVEDYAIPRLIADVKALLDHYSPDRKAILVGHDWGGAIAWSVAQAHPHRLERLVIINAPHPTIFARELAENPAQQRASAYMTFFRSPTAEATLSADDYAALKAAVFGAAARPDAFTAADRREYLKAWSQPGALTGGLNYYRAANLGLPTASAPGLRPPTRDTPSLAGRADTVASAPQSGGDRGVDQAAPPPAPGGRAPARWVAGGGTTVPTLVIWGETPPSSPAT